MKTRNALATVIIPAVAAQLNAGWMIEQSTTLPDGKQTSEALYIQNNKMAMTGEAHVIFNLETLEMTMIMPEEKMYMKWTPEMMESMSKMAPEWHGTVEVKKTSDTETIAGYEATKYQVLVDGKLDQEIWISKDLDLTSDLNLEKFNHMSEMRMPKATFQSSPEYQDLMNMGYPLREVQFQSDGKFITEVTKIEKKTISASQFEVPAGYQEMDMQHMMQGH